MAYSTLILVVLVFHCYEINGGGPPERQIPPQKGSSPLTNAGLLVQQVTSEIHNVGQMYFFYRENELMYLDTKVNGSLMTWKGKLGETTRHCIKELANEKIVTVVPTKQDPKKLLIGSDLNFRIYQSDGDKEHTITEPLVTFNEPGFIIHSAHADEEGTLLTLLLSKDQKNKTGKLYKVSNKTAHFVRNLEKASGDFRLNHECTKLYMICDHGKKIISFKYDMKTQNLSKEHTEVFNAEDYPDLKDHCMRSVVLDRDVGHLWVSAAGKTGYLLEINPNNKTLVCTIPLPNKDLTFVTYGATDYKAVFVGSKSTCTKGPGQGSIYSVTGMGRKGESDKPVKW